MVDGAYTCNMTCIRTARIRANMRVYVELSIAVDVVCVYVQYDMYTNSSFTCKYARIRGVVIGVDVVFVYVQYDMYTNSSYTCKYARIREI